MVYHIIIGSYSNNVTTLTFDSEARTLGVTSSIKVGHHPSWLTSHPSHPSLVWTGLEQSDGRVIALSFDESGKGKVVSETSSAGRDPCSLLALKDELLIANYSSGTIGSLPLTSGSSQLALTPVSVQLSGTGPNKSRQEGSHPHQVYFHEEYQELLVPDLGADAVYRLKKSEDGSWRLLGHVGFEAGGGPRHVAFYKGDLFTLLELSSKVVRHKFPSLPEPPKFIKSTSTMSKPPADLGDMLAAEIIIPTPNTSFPTPYLYISNRNDPSSEGDIISIFSIENPDNLELVGEVRSGLQHLRGMVFGGPDNKFLIAGGANGGGVKVYERINGGRSLKEIASSKAVEAPTAFLWL